MAIRQQKIQSIQQSIGGWRPLLAICGLGIGLTLTPIMAVEAAWTAAIKADPATRQSRCLLISDVVTTATGHLDDTTPVTLIFNGSSLRVVTESDLDSSFNDLQVVVDDKPPLLSKNIDHRTHLLFDQNLSELMQLMRSGRQVTAYLRFWPTWPATQTFPVSFSLVGFSRAHDSFNQNCQPVAAPASPAPSPPSRPTSPTPARPAR